MILIHFRRDLQRKNLQLLPNFKKITFFFHLGRGGIYWIRGIDLFRVWKGMSKRTSGWRKLEEVNQLWAVSLICCLW